MTSWFSNSTEDKKKIQRLEEEHKISEKKRKRLEEELNCRQSVKSLINEIRHDYKDIFVPFGEFVDNSFDWGKANHVKIILRENKIIIIDNGNGIKSKRLKKTLIFGSENEMLKKEQLENLD